MSTPTSPNSPHPQAGDRPFVVGTAGHVDHGKSTLVRALTGIDPDRLAEEQAREMTIDLGFAWLTLPGGRSVSIVDVPGHERFVRNMLAGVGGVDLAMLVVAADDGPMPQTREHLAILDLLGIDHGVVALTRIDLVEEEWGELVAEEVRELLAGTTLAEAPIVPVSSVTGAGLDALKTTLETQLEEIGDRNQGGRARLPVDRAFQVAGFGTVVTGTLLGGDMRVGQELMLYPDRRTVRVRGMQAHQHQVESAAPGSRVALNLGGIDHNEVRRGHVLASPGSLTPSMRLDCQVTMLADAPMTLEQNDELIVFSGADEVPARATLLDTEGIAPGEHGWVQLRLSRPMALLRGDRVILRRPSPATTVGGGVVVDPVPRRHKRFQRDVVERLAVMAQGTPEDLLLQALGDRAVEVGDLERESGMDGVRAVVEALVERGDVVALAGDSGAIGPRTVVLREDTMRRMQDVAAHLLDGHHRRYPLVPGPRRDELRSALGVRSQRVFDEIAGELERRNVLRSHGAHVAAPGFTIALDAGQRELADRFLAAARAGGYSPPSPQEHGLSAELLAALRSLGEVVLVADQIAYPADIFADIQARVLDHLERQTTITLGEYRDLFDTSRKFAQPTLEYLDERRITRRKGDVRVRYVGPGAGP